MHMRGGPADHIKFARYTNVVAEVVKFLSERARYAIAHGIARARIILDPGIGFSKNAFHNLELIRSLPRICALGYPVLIGSSRKAFVRRIAGASAEGMLLGTAAVDAIAIANGASIVRVHEPGPARAAVAMAAAISRGRIG
jgi:dihydropteroate synthase